MASDVVKDIKELERFIQIYCENKHKEREKTERNGMRLCLECHETLKYSTRRRNLCPLDPKPTCKNCTIHCYSTEHRKKIKEIMRYSGMYMIKRGRFDLLLHYLC